MSLLSSKTPFDLGLGFQDTHVLVTGGCGLIGEVVVQAFLSAGCNVTITDIAEECPIDQTDQHVLFQRADITSAEQMDAAFSAAEKKFGPVECCIALASLDLSVLKQSESLADMVCYPYSDSSHDTGSLMTTPVSFPDVSRSTETF